MIGSAFTRSWRSAGKRCDETEQQFCPQSFASEGKDALSDCVEGIVMEAQQSRTRALASAAKAHKSCARAGGVAIRIAANRATNWEYRFIELPKRVLAFSISESVIRLTCSRSHALPSRARFPIDQSSGSCGFQRVS